MHVGFINKAEFSKTKRDLSYQGKLFQKQISFKGYIEDDFFRASKTGDLHSQIRNLKDLRFDINEVDIETGNNFLHSVLKSGNRQLINAGLLLLGKKTVNNKELAYSVIQKTNLDGKKPYDYINDYVILNNLKKIAGDDFSLTTKPNETKEITSIAALNETKEKSAEKLPTEDDSLNKLPEGTILNIPSLDDDDDEEIVQVATNPDKTDTMSSQAIQDIFPELYSVKPLSEIAGLDKAKDILIKRIINPLDNGKKIVDSGFLIYGTAGNGKTYLLDSLQKSLNKEKIDAKKFGKLIDEALNGDNSPNLKQQKAAISEIFANNIIQVDSVQDLESVIDFAKENFRETNNQAIIYIDEIKGILPDVSAPYSKEVTKVEQLIENSAIKGFVIIATTREKNAIKPDSIRKGRFDEHIEVKLPSLDERKRFINRYLKTNNLSTDELNNLVKCTSGFSYLNMNKILCRINESGTIDFKSMKNEIENYAKSNGLGEISENGTTVNYDPPTLPRAVIKYPANFDDVAGMEEIKLKFKKLIVDRIQPEALERFRKNNRPPIKSGFLLYGPPGTGKTFIAEALAGETKLPFYRLDTATFEDSKVGESEKRIKEIFDKLEQKYRETGEYSIIFLDEANSILGNRENISEYKSNLVDEFLKRLNNSAEKGIITIVATNFKDKIDKAVLSRLGEPILVPPPDDEARKALIKLTFKNVETVKNLSEKDIDIITTLLSGLGARDIAYILSKTIDTPLAYSDSQLTLEDFKREIAEYSLSHDMPEINERNKTSAYDTYLKRVKIYPEDPQSLDDLGGMEDVKKQLIEAVCFESEHPDIAERLRKNKAALSSSVLLYGEPGCGKTFIMKALASHLKLPLYEFKLSEQSNSFIHGTTANIGKVFAQLKEKYEKTGEKSILILDEFEDVAGRRENNNFASHKQEETNALLKDISNAPKNGIIVVAATNFYNMIDDAMKRPGRFIQINVTQPDFESRTDILKKTLKGREIAENVVKDEDAIKKLVEITDGFSIADITETITPLIKNSIMNRVEKLTVDDFIRSFENFKEAKQLAKSKGK